jgi:hypothetical protein
MRNTLRAMALTSDPVERGGPPLIVAPTKRDERAWMQLFALIAVIVSALGFYLLLGKHSLSGFGSAALVAVILGAVALGSWRDLSKGGPTPLLIVTDRGLLHPVLGLIGWDEIRALTISKGRYGRWLNIELFDKAAYLQRVKSRPRRLGMRINLLLRQPLVSIPGGGTTLR